MSRDGGHEPVRRRVHDPLMARIHKEWAELRPRCLSLCGRELHLPAEGLRRAQAHRLNLVTHRARHAIGGFRMALLVLVQRKVRENFRLLRPSTRRGNASPACGTWSTHPEYRQPVPDDRCSRAARCPASTGRATSSPSHWPATRSQSKCPRRRASSTRCGTPRSGRRFEFVSVSFARAAATYRAAPVSNRPEVPPGATPSSPALPELAIGPVPQHVKISPLAAPGGIREWLTHADIHADMLPPTHRHLHLRHDVPVGLRSVHQVARGQKFHHRRPLAPQHVVLPERLPDRRVVKEALRGDLRCRAADPRPSGIAPRYWSGRADRTKRMAQRPWFRLRPVLCCPSAAACPPCRLRIEPVRRLENITCFSPSVMSPM